MNLKTMSFLSAVILSLAASPAMAAGLIINPNVNASDPEVPPNLGIRGIEVYAPPTATHGETTSNGTAQRAMTTPDNKEDGKEETRAAAPAPVTQ